MLACGLDHDAAQAAMLKYRLPGNTCVTQIGRNLPPIADCGCICARFLVRSRYTEASYVDLAPEDQASRSGNQAASAAVQTDWAERSKGFQVRAFFSLFSGSSSQAFTHFRTVLSGFSHCFSLISLMLFSRLLSVQERLAATHGGECDLRLPAGPVGFLGLHLLLHRNRRRH